MTHEEYQPGIRWKCPDCGETGEGSIPTECPNCGGWPRET